jgi:UDP-N-acetylglucosamine:LPS N-acetylglucosamine transferase
MNKVLIFSSCGGGGHTAVANALSEYLKNTHSVTINNIFSESLCGIDPIEKLSLGRRSGEDFYNYCMRRKWYNFINIYYKMGATYFGWRKKQVRALLREYIMQQKPDFIVSVIVIVNNDILAVAQELGIPFLLVPTDLDITTFLAQIKTPDYNRFNIALPFEDHEARIRLAQNQIPIEQTKITGFTIRPDFFEQKNIKQIKQEYSIPEDKPVILLLLGAVGLESLYTFTKELGKIDTEAHVIICTSKQEALKKRIDLIQFPAHLSKTTIGFTNRISDLMAISDLFITKSGSVSVCEALYMNLPLILDATTSLLEWEKANHRFIERHDVGTLLKNINDLAPLVSDLLRNPEQLALYKKNLIALEKKHGGNEIKRLIDTLLKS